jgi:hypothetical protein
LIECPNEDGSNDDGGIASGSFNLVKQVKNEGPDEEFPRKGVKALRWQPHHQTRLWKPRISQAKNIVKNLKRQIVRWFLHNFLIVFFIVIHISFSLH